MNGVRAFKVFAIHPGDEGLSRQLAGRFALINGHLFVLEDYTGLLSHLIPGPVTPSTQRRLDQLVNSQYVDVVAEDDIDSGKRLDLLKRVEFDDSGAEQENLADEPPSLFEYLRAGMDSPQVIEFTSGQALMNGQALSSEELETIHQNIRQGLATLRWRYGQGMTGVAKSGPELFEELAKSSGSAEQLHELMMRLHELRDQGHLTPEQVGTAHRHLYEDPMVSGVGNKTAYSDFVSRPRGGVHVMMDANDFKSINDDLSHQHGDEAIQKMGTAMRQAMDETVGNEHGKLFRFGGDEFAAHVPTPEHAHQFSRALRSKLEALAPIGGTHKISVSAGFGSTPEEADTALNVHAKGAKKAAVQAITGVSGTRQKVRAPHVMYAHSLIPGQEGPIHNGPARPPSIPAAPAQPSVTSSAPVPRSFPTPIPH